METEISNLHTVMMAAAVEITEQWDAHCDSEGYGPANLVRRLENGFHEKYGYDAKTIDTLQAKLNVAVNAMNQAMREYGGLGIRSILREALAEINRGE